MKKLPPELQKLVVRPHQAIRDAMRAINDNWREVALVVDSGGRVIGVITDGDIRRGLLAGLTLKSPLSRVMTTDYIHVGIQYSRGCPFNCEFCDIIELYGRVPRSKTAGQVIAELQRLYDLGYRGHVDFVDDNLIGNKKSLKIALPIIHQWVLQHGNPFFFSTEASINLVADEPLMKMMQDLDFRYLFIGIETPEDEILRQTQKKQNCKVSIKEAIQKIGRYGMIVNAGFILGFDSEGELSARHMIDCIEDSGVCMAMVGLLTALPNTQLTRRLTAEGRITTHGVKISDAGQIDQTTSGLNFMTLRPRVEILRDYLKIIESVYHPKNYYDRVLLTARQLQVVNKHKPGLGKMLNMAKAFTRLCWRVSWNRKIRKHYWSMFFRVLFGSPRSIEAAVNLGAMYLHFHKQSEYLKRLMTDQITNLELSKAA
jgi:hypothetical protein